MVAVYLAIHTHTNTLLTMVVRPGKKPGARWVWVATNALKEINLWCRSSTCFCDIAKEVKGWTDTGGLWGLSLKGFSKGSAGA